MLLLTLSLLAAAPDAPPAKPLPVISAPLGRLGTVVEPPPEGGTAPNDQVQVGVLEGCNKPQGFVLTNFVSGTLVALEQVQGWLNQTPGLEKKLFAAGKLGEVSHLVAAAAPMPQKLCTAPALAQGFKLELTRANEKLCPAPGGWRTGDFWWGKDGKSSAVVAFSPAASDAKDRCLPRLSLVLFDKAGVARLRLNADYNGAASFSLLGDKCVGFDFTFDEGTQAFVPTWRTAKGCKG